MSVMVGVPEEDPDVEPALAPAPELLELEAASPVPPPVDEPASFVPEVDDAAVESEALELPVPTGLAVLPEVAPVVEPLPDDGEPVPPVPTAPDEAVAESAMALVADPDAVLAVEAPPDDVEAAAALEVPVSHAAPEPAAHPAVEEG
jgi:hypothetical protein